MDELVTLLSDLVKIPSVCGDEGKIARFILKWLGRKKVSARLFPVKPGRPNVLARLKGAKPGPRIMLNGHMDTVEAGQGWKHDPFGAEIEGGRMYGRGTVDMKGGLASILWSAAQCRKEGLPKRGELVVAGVVDEEALDLGSYALVKKGITNGLDFAMIAEPTELSVVTSHMGRAVFDVTVHGRAAHSHWPDHGVNAIEKAAALITSLPRIEGPTHPKMGKSTINTLRIEGGQESTMLVPDRCRLVIDRCLVPGYTGNAALDDLKKLIRDTGVDAEAKLVDRETPFCDPFDIPDSHPKVQEIADIVTKALGKRPEIDYHGGPCDSCILVNQGKVPTIEFGPTGGRLHESDEYVELETVEKAAQVYSEIIRNYLS
jgi:acetylornithine deacetylase/succinyl-diaminopimelate desuccinylase family protein